MKQLAVDSYVNPGTQPCDMSILNETRIIKLADVNDKLTYAFDFHDHQRVFDWMAHTSTFITR